MLPAERENDVTLVKEMAARGAEILKPTNKWEIIRARTKYGVAILWTNSRGKLTPNDAMEKTQNDMKSGVKITPVQTIKRRATKTDQRINTLLERDGDKCFFCLRPIGGDLTIEHLLSVAHGGSNHICNMALAHNGCNKAAGHLPLMKKVQIRESALLAKC